MERKQYVQGKLFYEAERLEHHTEISFGYNERIQGLQKVISKLREDDLGNGHCFMIFDESLEEDEAFYEYPDGRISIERLNPKNIEVPRELIRVLNSTENKAVRNKHSIIG